MRRRKIEDNKEKRREKVTGDKGKENIYRT